MDLVTASTTPTSPAADSRNLQPGDIAEASVPAVSASEQAVIAAAGPRNTGSLARRMMLIAAAWITILLLVGGFALDRALKAQVTLGFDEQLNYSIMAMIGSAEIGPQGEVYFNRTLGDQRFLEPNSGLYFQISGRGHEDYASRSLWDRTLKLKGVPAPKPIYYNSSQFPEEPLRLVERTIKLPGSDVQWQFAVAGARTDLDDQIRQIRSILIWSFLVLGVGLLLIALLQTWYGLVPLRRVRRAISDIRNGRSNRITVPLPVEVQPMVEELNALLAHSETQAEEARRHAGNLAHALKTPLTVLNNAASAHAPDLDATVKREAATMRRQVDHHLARARAVGRRAMGHSRTNVMASVEAVERAVAALYPKVRFDLDGSRSAEAAIERQDLDEILGNLIENAAKYGGGSVFVTVDPRPGEPQCSVWVEDDGAGISETDRAKLFSRGARLDTTKPGTGLGLAIVRDVAEIYGGSVELDESEDLGGVLVRLMLPRST